MTGGVAITPVGPVCSLGEGPHWVPAEHALYYVSILEQEVHRYDYKTGKDTKAHIETGGPVSLVVPVAGHKDNYVISQGKDMSVLTWENDKKTLHSLGHVDNKYPDNRINDGKCDPSGRLYFGTMAKETAPTVLPHDEATLYSLEANGDIRTRCQPITLSNGLAWSSDHKTMFFIDSADYKVYAFDFNLDTGDMSNKRTLFDLKKANVEGIPDGMTIDTTGNLWVCTFLGGKIFNVDSHTGEIIRTVDIPSLNVTSACFGGEHLDELFVTTATICTPEEKLAATPHAGKTFKVTGLGVKGFESVPCNIKLKHLEH